MLCDCFEHKVTKHCVCRYRHTHPAQKDKREWTALHHAAYDNLVHDVEMLLMQDPTRMSVNADGDTALSLAVENGCVESFLCLIQYQDWESIVDEMLQVAITYDQLRVVKAMIPYINEKKPLHKALRLAAQMGRVNILRALSRFIPSDLIVDEGNQRTLFHIAAMFDQVDVLRYLDLICSSDAIVAKDNCGNTQLHFATGIGMCSFNAFKFIVDTYPQLLSIANNDDFAPLMAALHHRNGPVIHYLLDRYPECVHLPTKHGQTPLHLAPCVHIAKRLHAIHPTLIDVVTITGGTPLHSAVRIMDIDLVEYLLTLKPSAILAKDFHCSPLYYAQKIQFSPPVKKFITLMPDLDDVDSQGNTVLHIAAKHFSLQEDESTLQRVFDSHEKDIKTPNKDGDTPYHIARTHNNQFAIRIYERYVPICDMFDIHTQYNPLDTSELQRSVTQQCVSLDMYLLPDLHFLVQEFLGTHTQKTKKRKL